MRLAVFFFLLQGVLLLEFTQHGQMVCVCMYVCVLVGGRGHLFGFSYCTGLPKFSHLSVLHAFTSGAYRCTVCACMCFRNLVWFWIDLTTMAPCFVINSKVFRTEMNLKYHRNINLNEYRRKHFWSKRPLTLAHSNSKSFLTSLATPLLYFYNMI